MENSSETQLLHHCAQRGNDRAWSELVQRFDSQLQMAVRRGLRRGGAKLSVDEVNEMVQEVYCRLLDNDSRHLRDFRGNCEMEAAAYLSRIAETVVRDQLRRQRALKRGGFHLAMRQVDLASLVVTRIDTRACPERRALARSQLRRLLERCVLSIGGRDSSAEVIAGLSPRARSEIEAEMLEHGRASVLARRIGEDSFRVLESAVERKSSRYFQ